MSSGQHLSFGEKALLGFRAAGAFARNPKALVALVKYKLNERKQGPQPPITPEQ